MAYALIKICEDDTVCIIVYNSLQRGLRRQCDTDEA
jgi:hypothetical protein